MPIDVPEVTPALEKGKAKLLENLKGRYGDLTETELKIALDSYASGFSEGGQLAIEQVLDFVETIDEDR
jgi:hypothetical protein